MAESSLPTEVESQLERHGAGEEGLTRVLETVLAHFGAVTGTIHDLDDASGNLLRLRAQIGIPEAILDRVQRIPVGKGMAGIAAERREPVQVCNLQTDDSGVVRPAARETRVEGAITVPVLLNDELRGTLGIAMKEAHTFTDDEVAVLETVARSLGDALGKTPPSRS